MSYIFEALQRAENERAGGNLPKKVDTVAELLQGVEQEIARKQAEEARAAGALMVDAVAEMPIADSPATVVETEAAVLPHAVPSVAEEQRGIDLARGTELPRVTLPTVKTPGEAAVAKSPSPAAKTPATTATVEKTATGETGFAQAKVLVPALLSDSRLVCLTDQGGLAAEKFRVLGLKLRHLREKRKLKRIVVTGTAPEEGKSLVAANLALNQSRSKVLKTLLIDGDLRRPTVASRFGFDSSLAGLSECLRAEKELSEVVYKLNGSGLWFLPAGRAPENPLELMQGGRLPELLERLGEFFDWIIIDTPPVVPVADTTFWMKQADGVLLVIREGVSEKKVVERALDSFDRATLLGVIVNSCSRTEHTNYYSRYGQAAPGANEKSSAAETL
jgi:capsular exopolysaccharide synthesis family protein